MYSVQCTCTRIALHSIIYSLECPKLSTSAKRPSPLHSPLDILYLTNTYWRTHTDAQTFKNRTSTNLYYSTMCYSCQVNQTGWREQNSLYINWDFCFRSEMINSTNALDYPDLNERMSHATRADSPRKALTALKAVFLSLHGMHSLQFPLVRRDRHYRPLLNAAPIETQRVRTCGSLKY